MKKKFVIRVSPCAEHPELIRCINESIPWGRGEKWKSGHQRTSIKYNWPRHFNNPDNFHVLPPPFFPSPETVHFKQTKSFNKTTQIHPPDLKFTSKQINLTSYFSVIAANTSEGWEQVFGLSPAFSFWWSQFTWDSHLKKKKKKMNK